MPLTDALRKQIGDLVSKNEIVLFMKGTPRSPACGFSARTIEVLEDLGSAYTTVDVLSDPAIRDGIKEYSEWPTIPQLYVKGTFVGGADIVRDMHESGELAKLMGLGDATATPPSITVTQAAAKAFADALSDAGGDVLRFSVSPRFEYDLFLGPKAEGDLEVDGGGLHLFVDRASARRANGTKIDFVETPKGGGFKIENPNEPPKVKQIGPEELAKMLEAGSVRLFDVRTPRERDIAKIEGARLVDAEVQDEIAKLPKDTLIVFHCHHGGRSQSAAEHFLGQGFTNLHNLAGGIDAWSMRVDPKVPRY